ncbi:hypothetical protein HMN09_00405600 [Mycena chlorophos]|uniref:Uncharacterized protein n=1 Tax=Mycena chlorophos TaxID=658473 RepID=A0A8H6TFS4_MYCCL|nr:hypothetical protein HMN09_00405600 [Mycena chlorophos]
MATANWQTEEIGAGRHLVQNTGLRHNGQLKLVRVTLVSTDSPVIMLATLESRPLALLRGTEDIRPEGQRSDDSELLPSSPNADFDSISVASSPSATGAGLASFLEDLSASRPSSRLRVSDFDDSDLECSVTVEDPKHVCGNIFVRGGTAKCLPRRHDGFAEIAETAGVPFMFRHEALEQFTRVLGCSYPLLLRLPKGWGLDTFVSMIICALDCEYDEDDDPFSALLPYHHSTWLSQGILHGFIVLELDFLHVRSESDLRAKLIRFVFAHCRATLRHYDIPQQFGLFAPHKHAGEVIFSFAAFLDLFRPSTPLFLVIKNFDFLVFGAKDGREVLEEFLGHLEFQCDIRNIGGVLLASTLDNGSLYRYNNSGTPESPPYPIQLRSTLDLTRHPVFQSVVGFTEKDINDVDEVFKWKGSPGPRLLDMVKEIVREAVVFADQDWSDDRVAPVGPDGPDAKAKAPPAPDVLWTICRDGVFPARIVMTCLQKKYGFPLRTPRAGSEAR